MKLIEAQASITQLLARARNPERSDNVYTRCTKASPTPMFIGYFSQIQANVTEVIPIIGLPGEHSGEKGRLVKGGTAVCQAREGAQQRKIAAQGASPG